jgi:tRNA modification GTPase
MDTIAAVASAWEPAPVGILRLSGPGSFAAAELLGLTPPAITRSVWTEGRLRLDADCALPATVYWFRAPHSYTGQDAVEVHTVGCLPLLRAASAKLIGGGARRALPGEFTARAFLEGKLSAHDVEAVLGLMQSQEQSGARAAQRLRHDSRQERVAGAAERITALLASIEAGIDFVDEEDVRLISSAEVAAALEGLTADLDAVDADAAFDPRAGKPHVALVGLPNAGKSTLFNALLGSERALVSPVLGTTRDVLSAEIDLDGVRAVIQDCGGLGGGTDELELATHLAAERAAEQADLVLWIHPADVAWDARAADACACVPADRRVLVRSKLDLAPDRAGEQPPASFAAVVDVSAATGLGLARLRTEIARRLSRTGGAMVAAGERTEARAAVAALRRARDLVATSSKELASPELVAIELREAREQLAECGAPPADEAVLERIFTQFCVGK